MDRDILHKESKYIRLEARERKARVGSSDDDVNRGLNRNLSISLAVLPTFFSCLFAGAPTTYELCVLNINSVNVYVNRPLQSGELRSTLQNVDTA